MHAGLMLPLPMVAAHMQASVHDSRQATADERHWCAHVAASQNNHRPHCTASTQALCSAAAFSHATSVIARGFKSVGIFCCSGRGAPAGPQKTWKRSAWACQQAGQVQELFPAKFPSRRQLWLHQNRLSAEPEGPVIFPILSEHRACRDSKPAPGLPVTHSYCANMLSVS